ncbi:TPA: hypothetical protein ACH3X2_012803 [Trebouxia sp. C0005]
MTCQHYYQLLKSQLALYFPNTEELQLVTPCLSQLSDLENAPESFCYGIAYVWRANWHLAECAVTTSACRGQYFRVREEDRVDGWRDQDHEWPRISPWAPFDDDGQYCECNTDRMMSQHDLDLIIYPQHPEFGLTERPGIPKCIIITLLKEAITVLRGSVLAAAKQQLAHLMESSGSQQKMSVPVHSDAVVDELKYYIMLQSLQQKPGWINTSCVNRVQYTALCSTEYLFRHIHCTRSTLAWSFDEWFSNAPAHGDETTYFGLYTINYLVTCEYKMDGKCYTLMQIASSIFGD